MKKLFLIMTISALVLGMTQCRKPVLEPIGPIMPEGERQTITFGSDGSKIVVNNLSSLVWECNDVLYVYEQGTQNRYLGYISTTGQGSSTAQFSGDILKPAAGNQVLFYYYGASAATGTRSQATAPTVNVNFATQQGNDWEGYTGIQNNLVMCFKTDVKDDGCYTGSLKPCFAVLPIELLSTSKTTVSGEVTVSSCPATGLTVDGNGNLTLTTSGENTITYNNENRKVIMAVPAERTGKDEKVRFNTTVSGIAGTFDLILDDATVTQGSIVDATKIKAVKGASAATNPEYVNVAEEDGYLTIDKSDHQTLLVKDKFVGSDPLTITNVEPEQGVVLNVNTNTKYPTLAGGIEAAVAGQTLRLLKDIELNTVNGGNKEYSAVYIDKSLTIDLNQKTITVTKQQASGDEATAIVVMNSSNDITVDIHGGSVVTTNAANGIMARDHANLTLSNMTVNQQGLSDIDVYRHAAVTATKGAKVHIVNGNYTGEYYSVYNKANGGQITVDGGTFKIHKNNVEPYSENRSPAVVRADFATLSNCKVTINGGTFGDENQEAFVLDIGGASDAVFTVNDGEFYGVSQSQFSGDPLRTIFKGGIFHGTVFKFNGGHIGAIEFVGGQYVDDLTTSFATSYPNAKIADGYEAVANTPSEGWWTVQPQTGGEVRVTSTSKSVEIMMLCDFRDKVNDGNSTYGDFSGCTVELLTSIDMAAKGYNPWTPIGTSTHPFAGVFDGCNKTISGMTVNTTDDAGFFGYVSGAANTSYTQLSDIWNNNTLNEANIVESKYTAVIKNLNIASCNVVASNKYSGAVVGRAFNAYLYNLQLLSGTLSADKYVAGIAGVIGGSVIKSCTNVAGCNISAGTYHVAGIVGSAGYVSGYSSNAVINCTNNVAITQNVQGGSASGVIGTANTGATNGSAIIGCINNANITGSTSKGGHVAGIVPDAQGASIVANCTNNGNITTTGNMSTTAGVCGNMCGGEINYRNGVYNCTNTGAVSAAAGETAGIIASIERVGTSIPVVDACTNTGNISSTGTANTSTILCNIYGGAITLKNMTFANETALSAALPKTGHSYTDDLIIDQTVTVTDKTDVLNIGNIRKVHGYQGLCEKFSYPNGTTQSSGDNKSFYAYIPGATLYIGSGQTLTATTGELGSDNMAFENNGTYNGNMEFTGANITVTNNGTINSSGGNTLVFKGANGSFINNGSFGSNYYIYVDANTTIKNTETMCGFAVRNGIVSISEGQYETSKLSTAGGTIELSGGIYTTKPSDTYIKSGYQAIENSDPTYKWKVVSAK